MWKCISKMKLHWTTTIWPKWQIVIPKEARDMFSINPGDSVVILCDKKKGMAIVKTEVFDAVSEDILGKGNNIKWIWLKQRI